MSYKYRITVFTPTYNRAYIIERLFQSLCSQSFKDFEWVVVDDGSEDDTEAMFEQFKLAADFKINYIKVKNGGKHRAINIGVENAKGELFFIVDSDDYILPNSLERIDLIEKTIPRDKKFSGVRGLKGYSKNKVIGTKFPAKNSIDITMLEETRKGVTGDKCEAFYTRVMKEFPFPEFEGEKFVTECVVWDKMAANGYKNRCVNEILYVAEYQPDGLSATVKEHHKKSPKGSGLYIYQSIKYKKIKGWEKRYKIKGYYNTHRDTLDFNEVSENLHMKPLELKIKLKIIDTMIWFRQKKKGLLRRFKANI